MTLNWAIFICCLLAILSNKYTASLFLPSETRIAGWIPPPLLLFLAYSTMPVRLSFSLSSTNDLITCYIYLAFGFGFSLSNIRQSRKGLKINGIVFLVIFALLISMNLFQIIELWKNLSMIAYERGYR